MSSSLPTVLPAEIDQTTDLAHHCDVYTNALAQNDRLLSSDLSSDLSRPQLQALVSDESTMSQGHIAMWQLAEVGYEDVPAESYRDDFSDIEACSWEDALQAIDEYDWSFTEQGHEHEFPGDSANQIGAAMTTMSVSLEPSPVTVTSSDEVKAAQISATLLDEAEHRQSITETDEQQPASSAPSKSDTTSKHAEVPVTNPVPEKLDADADVDASTAGTLELQAAPIEPPGREPADSTAATPTEHVDQPEVPYVESENVHYVLPMPCVLQSGSTPHDRKSNQKATKDSRDTDCPDTQPWASSELELLINESLTKEPKSKESAETEHPHDQKNPSTEERPSLPSEPSESRRTSIAREDSDVELYNAASPADTVATSIAEVLDAIECPDGERPACVSVSGEKDMDRTNWSPPAFTNNTAVSKETGATDMADQDGEVQQVPPQPAPDTTANIAANNTVRLPGTSDTVVGRTKLRDTTLPTEEEPTGGNGFLQPTERTTDHTTPPWSELTFPTTTSTPTPSSTPSKRAVLHETSHSPPAPHPARSDARTPRPPVEENHCAPAGSESTSDPVPASLDAVMDALAEYSLCTPRKHKRCLPTESDVDAESDSDIDEQPVVKKQRVEGGIPTTEHVTSAIAASMAQTPAKGDVGGVRVSDTPSSARDASADTVADTVAVAEPDTVASTDRQRLRQRCNGPYTLTDDEMVERVGTSSPSPSPSLPPEEDSDSDSDSDLTEASDEEMKRLSKFAEDRGPKPVVLSGGVERRRGIAVRRRGRLVN